MSDTNVIVYQGRLGKDSELRATASGTNILSFSLANSYKRGDKESTSWMDCVVFGQRAPSLQPYLTRGRKVTVTGRIRQYKSESNGRSYNNIEIVVDEVSFDSVSQTRQQQEQAAQPAAPVDMYAEDIPF